MIVWEMLGWTVSVGAAVVLLGIVAWMVYARITGSAAVNAAGGEEFAIERYQAMERLLSGEDLAFLQSQPGYEPAMGERWKRERRQIFRQYLCELRQDFRRLHAEARALVAGSSGESSHLVGLLLRQQATFLCAAAVLDIRLFLGWGGSANEVRRFVAVVEALRTELNTRRLPQAV
jgi:uncharacterized membrane protein